MGRLRRETVTGVLREQYCENKMHLFGLAHSCSELRGNIQDGRSAAGKQVRAA